SRGDIGRRRDPSAHEPLLWQGRPVFRGCLSGKKKNDKERCAHFPAHGIILPMQDRGRRTGNGKAAHGVQARKAPATTSISSVTRQEEVEAEHSTGVWPQDDVSRSDCDRGVRYFMLLTTRRRCLSRRRR